MRSILAVFFIAASPLALAQPGVDGDSVRARQMVSGQAVFARTQLQAIAALLATDPDGTISREFFHSGNAMVMTGQYSPVLGWPARGPTPKEALPLLLASIDADALACRELSGPCQDRARKAGIGEAGLILRAAHPGKVLAAILANRQSVGTP